jgi:hypothetical protein
LAVFQDFSKKCSNSRTDSKFQDIPGQNFFSRISRTGGRPAFDYLEGCHPPESPSTTPLVETQFNNEAFRYAVQKPQK